MTPHCKTPAPMPLIGYARVSTDDQTLRPQVEAPSLHDVRE